ncbi:hypothetical protein BH10ACT3_BH10ACT3_14010 [soil metagenome]
MKVRGSEGPGERTPLVLGSVFMVAVLVAIAMLLNTVTYDVAISMAVLVVIVAVSVPVFRHLSQVDDDPPLFWILLSGLLAKMAFSLARYWMVNTLYDGAGDSTRYDADGWVFAQRVRAGSLTPAVPSIDNVESGTRRIIKLTGYVYAVIGHSKFAGFFLFSLLAFVGCLLFARGARRAFPEMNHRRYLLLVLFWPSLLFWPSSIGKDAVMVFLLGVATYGASALLAPRPRLWGAAVFALGVGGMLLVRVHVALMAVLAVAVATAFAFVGGTRTEGASGRGRAVRIVGLVVMVLLALTAMTQTTRFFDDQAGEATSNTEALELTVKRTQQGGSQFQPIVVTNPLQVPAATVSVLFRPFPWEASGVGTLISAAEGAIIGVLFVVSWRRLLRWPGSAWRRPILVFGALYCLMFVVAFSSIGNAGILARQRVQLLPLLFLAFAVPVVRWWKTDDVGAPVGNDDPMIVNSVAPVSVGAVTRERAE